MTHRERYLSAIRFEGTDFPALEYYYTDVGYAEHGARLLALYRRFPGDASPAPSDSPRDLPRPDPADVDERGDYRRVDTDEWGTRWEYRIFGRIGHATRFPLADIGRLDCYRLPPMPLDNQFNLSRLRERVSDNGGYPVGHGVPGLLERMIALRPFEDVLADIASDDPAIHALADRLADAFAREAAAAIEAGVDFIRIGDDYGTERSLIISPDMWRGFFMPRLERIIAPAKRAGKLCLFHSCGRIAEILPDIAAIGADSIWPQLPLYDYGYLAGALRELRLALCIHIDRGELMQRGTALDVRAEVDRAYRAFKPESGGAWFYYEADQGFPFRNLLALAEAIGEYRIGLPVA